MHTIKQQRLTAQNNTIQLLRDSRENSVGSQEGSMGSSLNNIEINNAFSMGLVSEKAKHREWKDFVKFIKEDPQTMLNLVSQAEPSTSKVKTIKPNVSFFSPKSS